MVRRSPQVEAVLAALAAGPTYGLAIMRRTGLKSGTVYPILHRMETAGWVNGARDEHTTAAGRPPRRVYQLTTRAPAHG
jgi:DNA-binding PadR family transcriptional regulator